MRRIKFVFVTLVMMGVSGCLTHSSLLSSGMVGGPLQDDASVAVTVSRATDLEKKDDWPGALEIYRFALSRNPKDKDLESAHAAFMKRRGAYLARLEVDMLIAQAQWLQKQRLYDEAAKGLEEGLKSEEKIAVIAKSLAGRGEEALARKDYRLAKRAIPQAVKLHSSPETESAYQKWIDWVKKARVAKGQRQATIAEKKNLAQN